MNNLPSLALSIRQPWAWAIINAGKDIENRSWATKQRGPICIHASQYKPRQVDIDDFNETFRAAIPDEQDRAKICPRHTEALSFHRGGIIGTAEIADCIESSESPWFFGSYGFVLRNVRPVEFVPVKGSLGFFDWRKNLEQPQ
ncbi:MAG: ASCH domain-containing protein [Cypionkella sp.]|uniref:ASCH domain-containing protein n=1 Tax=Cypionkella sp. TaxID=2811411 RepID=UPI00273155A2|nr:ASCH domain-containing protein [Cypionkella sp.]MDP2047538.1 ASCH domain-containing protein [Cypionkella sp.]